MTSYPNDGMCHETSGFLFNHRCEHFSQKECMFCQKPVCQFHGHTGPDGVLCTTCLKKSGMGQANPNQPMPGKVQPPGSVPPPVPQQGVTPGMPNANPQGSQFQSTQYGSTYYGPTYYDDPYFYGSTWYPNYGYRHRRWSSSTNRRVTDANDSSDAGDAVGAGASNSIPDHDPHDFTEGDAESMVHEGDESFESEMGES